MNRIMMIIGQLGKQAGERVHKATPMSKNVKPDQAASFLETPVRASQHPHRYGTKKRKPYSGLFKRDSS